MSPSQRRIGSEVSTGWTRREILRMSGAVVVAPLTAAGALAATDGATVPTRPFGRDGRPVSILGLGGFVDPLAHPELLSLAFERGVRYWEATLSKGAAGYGAYFRKHPSHREQVFLLGKTRGRDAAGMQEGLERVLTDAATSYLDFFVVTSVSDVDFLTPEVCDWVAAAKREGKLRQFGFSTHENMAACLREAAAHDCVDGIVTAYNYRLMRDPHMQRAIGACADRGIALTAIKSQALPTNPAASIGAESAEARAALGPWSDDDPRFAQAKLRAVWSDPRFASILSLMRDASQLEANVAAARLDTPLGRREWGILDRYAGETMSSYCAGCAARCEPRVAAGIPIAAIQRYRMYARGYGDPERARAAFRRLPTETRRSIATADYGEAERHCPQGLAIGELMREAARELA